MPCTGRGHGAAGPQPSKVIKLFSGGTFDAQYNARRPTLRFRTPNGTERALLEAVITGASCASGTMFLITHHIINQVMYH